MIPLTIVKENSYLLKTLDIIANARKIYLCLLFSLSISTLATGQAITTPDFKILSDTAAYFLLPDSNFQMMKNPGGKLDLQQVINADIFKNDDKKINYKIRDYWLRFSITNDLFQEVRIALPEPAARADLYTRIGNNNWQHAMTGTQVPWSQRDGLKRIPAFVVAIPSNETLTVYKKIHWDFLAAQPDSLKVSFSFADKLILHNYVNDELHYMTAIQDAFLLGLFVLSMIINFYFFLVVREKEFLYFALFLLLFSLQDLTSLNDVFLTENPNFSLYLYILCNSLVSFVFIQFIRYSLKTFHRFPRWDKYLYIFSLVQICILLSAYFASSVLQTNLSSFSHYTENIIKLIYGISMLITVFLYIRVKEKSVKMVLIALTPILLLQIMAYSLAVLFGLYYPRFGAQDISGYESEFNKVALFILILCYLWMMIFFTWVMFSRFSVLRKELAQKAELSGMKSRFFANISHEFRTPLTLIMGPIEDLLQNKETKRFRKDLQYIHRNSKRLLQLINQLLDLSKLDVGNYQVNTTRQDIVPFVTQIVHSFYSMAQRKNISLEIKVDPEFKNGLRNEIISFYFDEDVIEKILTNLLSNAFKFTPVDGNIVVSICAAQKDLFELKVEDNGFGIPPEKLPFIFDRFYQADNTNKKQYEGTGIGLALVKELVTLHEGRISVESTVNKGTTFHCYFPLNKKIISKKSISRIKESPKLVAAIDDGDNIESGEHLVENRQLKVLVVEDEQDVGKYIRGKLDEIYTVLDARNGKEGLEIAKQQIPDMIISDVMMPEMDGFELCRLLKTDDITSHIPVILLTALAEDADKLSGLAVSADAYLIKPFNSKELLLRVHNLIELRNKLRKKFSGKLVVKPSDITVTSQDSQFMQRLQNTVEKHLNDENFSVEQLAREFGMSPSQINRKLKAIINQSAGAFIRSLRMERAMELLKNDKATIAEIAYETGFREPAYFSRIFKIYFGYSPSEVKK